MMVKFGADVSVVSRPAPGNREMNTKERAKLEKLAQQLNDVYQDVSDDELKIDIVSYGVFDKANHHVVFADITHDEKSSALLAGTFLRKFSEPVWKYKSRIMGVINNLTPFQKEISPLKKFSWKLY